MTGIDARGVVEDIDDPCLDVVDEGGEVLGGVGLAHPAREDGRLLTVNTSTGGTRVLLYARISEDTTGDAVGVSRQLAEARKLAEVNGWHVVGEEVDNDVSALKGGARPGYRRVLEQVRVGAIDHVVCWQTSRLLRNRRERAEAIELFGQQRVGIIAVKGISFDLTTAYGRGQAGLMGEFDTMESEVKAERVAAAAADRAQRGQPSGHLGYGWDKQGTGTQAKYTENPHEAGIVREIVARLLAGETLRGITADLNERGEPAPKSPTWGKTTVKKLAMRESNVAVRVHHRGRADEARYAGAWPAIVEQDKHEKVVALLSQPARRTNKGPARPGARRHLLSWGVGECGACGGQLRAVTKRGPHGKPQHLYVCDPGGCVGRNQANVDELLAQVVVARLAKPDALDWLLGDDAEARRWAERTAELRRRLDDAADSYAEGEISRDQLRRITAKLQPDLKAAEAHHQQAAQTLDLDTLRPLAGPEAATRWASMTVAQRRAVVEALGMKVVILKRGRGGPGFEPESVRFEWRSS